MSARRPKTIKCRRCGKKIRPKPKGRLPTYCRSCRQRHYEEGRAGRAQAVLAQEINSVKVRQVISAEVKRYLDRFKIEAPPPSQAAKPKKPPKPLLRIIRSDERTDQVSPHLADPNQK